MPGSFELTVVPASPVMILPRSASAPMAPAGYRDRASRAGRDRAHRAMALGGGLHVRTVARVWVRERTVGHRAAAGGHPAGTLRLQRGRRVRTARIRGGGVEPGGTARAAPARCSRR